MGKKEYAMGLGLIAAIGGGTREGLKKLDPILEMAHVEAMVGDHEAQIKYTTRDIKGVIQTIDRDLKDPSITEAVRSKLEVQKKAFLLAVQALEGGKSTPHEQK